MHPGPVSGGRVREALVEFATCSMTADEFLQQAVNLAFSAYQPLIDQAERSGHSGVAKVLKEKQDAALRHATRLADRAGMRRPEDSRRSR